MNHEQFTYAYHNNTSVNVKKVHHPILDRNSQFLAVYNGLSYWLKVYIVKPDNYVQIAEYLSDWNEDLDNHDPASIDLALDHGWKLLNDN